MAEELEPGEILRRAIAYPYEAPPRSYLQAGPHSRDLAAGARLALDGREPLLAYGSNASPAVLARKLSGLPPDPLPALRAELAGYDVVYSAHVSPYGAVPATLRRDEGTTVPVFVLWPNAGQLERLTATEPNYELRRLGGLELRVDLVGTVAEASAFVSRHGCLALDGSEVALAAVEAAGRRLPALGEAEVLERVRRLLAPQLSLERFVETSLDPATAAARTARLRAVAGASDGGEAA